MVDHDVQLVYDKGKLSFLGPKKKCVFPVACLKIIGSVGRLFFFLSNPIVTIVKLTMALLAVQKN
jgi:hypothetical protein